MNSKNNPTSKSSKIRVALAMGDPAGIGPAIALKALKILKNKADLTLIGNSFVLSKASRLLRINSVPLKLIDINNINKDNFEFGRISKQNGKASLEYLDAALGLIKSNEADCLVTCPVSKKAISLSLPGFSGQTEYLAGGENKDLIMMLLNEKLKFSLLTRHIPLRDVSSKINKKILRENISGTIKGLKNLFLIQNPRVVVCGLNPHASDNGLIGNEEKQILFPVIDEFRQKPGSKIDGPLPADIAISLAQKQKFDCVIAAYHDQALIALKLTGFDSGVNLTLGLDFVRTSPLHGTAFDIASRPVLANPGSLISAIKLAIQCASNQKRA